MTPTTNAATTAPAATPESTLPQVAVTTVVPTTHSNFSKLMAVLAALEPVILMGISPFIKNAHSQAIVASEHPVAQTLLQALSEL